MVVLSGGIIVLLHRCKAGLEEVEEEVEKEKKGRGKRKKVTRKDETEKRENKIIKRRVKEWHIGG